MRLLRGEEDDILDLKSRFGPIIMSKSIELFDPSECTFWVIFSFVSAFVLAPFSRGFGYLIIWYLAFEFFYLTYYLVSDINKLDHEYWFYHLALILAGLVGFFLGRKILNEDKKPWQLWSD